MFIIDGLKKIHSLFTGENKTENTNEEESSIFDFSKIKEESREYVDNIMDELDNLKEKILISGEIKDLNEMADEDINYANDAFDKLNVSSSLKKELEGLYSALQNTTDKNAKEQIQALIDNTYARHGEDSNNVMALEVEKNSISASNRKRIADLYEMLSETNDETVKDSIYAAIKKTREEGRVEITKLEGTQAIQDSNITDKQKEDLQRIFDSVETIDYRDRETLYAKLDQYCAENNIDGNSFLVQHLKNNCAEIIQSKTNENLYEMLANADESSRDSILAAMKSINNELETESETFFIKSHLAMYSENEKENDNVQEMYDLMSNTENEEIKEGIMNILLERLEEKDEKRTEYLRKRIEANEIEKKYNKELTELYEKLAEAEGKDTRNTIQAEIEETTASMRAETDAIYGK